MKPGMYSSEFWLQLAAVVVAGLGLVDNEMAYAILGSVGLYTVARVHVKAKASASNGGAA